MGWRADLRRRRAAGDLGGGSRGNRCVSLVRQHGWSGETLELAAGHAACSARRLCFLPRVFPDGLPVRGYGVMLLVGIFAGVGMAMLSCAARRPRSRSDHLAGDLAGRLRRDRCAVVSRRSSIGTNSLPAEGLRETLLEIVNVPEGGLVIYGGFFGAAVGFVVFVRKHRLPLLAMADLVAPSMAIGLAFGRIGCFLNGCCYGGQTDWPWAVTFPEVQLAMRSREAAGAAALQPAVFRSGGARRDARLPHRSRAKRRKLSSRELRRLARGRGGPGGWRCRQSASATIASNRSPTPSRGFSPASKHNSRSS